MKKLTTAQQRMITRAKQRDVIRSRVIDCALTKEQQGLNRLIELSAKYEKPFYGATVLCGSSDFRVAYNLQDAGIGRICSEQISDRYFFILERECQI